MRSLCQAAFVLLASMATASAWATEPTTSVDNLCPSPGGQGEHCNSSADCQSHTYATLCVEHGSTSSSDRSCEIPCGAGEGVGHGEGVRGWERR